MQLDMPVIDSSVVLVKVVVMAVVSQNMQTGLIQYILIDQRLCSTHLNIANIRYHLLEYQFVL